MTPAKATSILVTGASGSLGAAIATRLDQAGHRLILQHHQHALPSITPVAGERGASRDASHERILPIALDLTDLAATRAILDRERPLTIVHAAAATDVDWYEEHPQEARRINVDATAGLVAWTAANDARFIYISTDLVFDGRAAPYDETAAVNPLSHYARTKLEGELCTREAAERGGNTLVMRVALLYGRGSPHRGTFLDFLLGRFARGEATTLFTDQFRTPAWLDDVAHAVEAAIARESPGLLHIGGPRRLSRFEFGVAVAGLLGISNELLRPGRFREHGFRGDRPADVSLVSARSERELGIRCHPLSEALAAMVASGRLSAPAAPPPGAAR